MSKIQALAKAKAELKRLKELKEQAQRWANSPWLKKIGGESLEKLNQKIEYYSKYIEQATDVVDLVDSTAAGKIPAKVGSALDEYIEKYGQYDDDLFNTGLQKKGIGPFYGVVFVDVSFYAALAAKLETERNGGSVISKGSINGDARVGVGVSIGFDIPVVGSCKIGGGIQGGVSLNGKGSISMELKNYKLSGTLGKTNLNVKMVAELYLDTPLPKSILGYVPDYVPSIKVRGSRLLYPIGSVNILLVKTPSYTLSFDLSKGEFRNRGAQGQYVFYLHPRVKRYLKDVVDGIEQAADSVVDAMNPLTWDWNPFD
jgi:hypothetical protein